MDQDVKNKISTTARVLRFILVSAILCACMSVSYSLYGGKFSEILLKLENANSTMENMIWLYKHAVNIFPCILVVILQVLAYIPDKDRKLACKERKWQMLILFLFVYVVLLRSAMNGQGFSVLGDSALWFGTQLIPIIILSLYYSQRQHTVDEPHEVHPDEIVSESAEEKIKGK